MSFESDKALFLGIAYNINKNIDTMTEKEFRATIALLIPMMMGKPKAKSGFTIEDANLCSRCNYNLATEPHTCPYGSEINGDDTPCTCCESCTDLCADEI